MPPPGPAFLSVTELGLLLSALWERPALQGLSYSVLDHTPVSPKPSTPQKESVALDSLVTRLLGSAHRLDVPSLWRKRLANF